MRSIIILIPLLIFTPSCTTMKILPGYAKHNLFMNTLSEEQFFLLSGNISLKSDMNRDETLSLARQTLTLLIDRQNSQITKKDAKEARVNLNLREYSFLKDYRLVKTLSLELLIVNAEGDFLARYYHTEESENSFF
jgi:hypothetical protein